MKNSSHFGNFACGHETNSNLIKTIKSYSNYDFTSNTGTAIHQNSKTFEPTRDVLDVISSTNSSTNAVISGSDYSVNAIGQRTGISRSGSATPASGSASDGYNNRGELISAGEATNAQDRAYQFDGIGNRQKTVSGSLTLPGSNNHSVNALNQYTSIPNLPATPSYDDDGNATAYPLPINPATNATLTYDGEHTRRLVGWADYTECSSARSDFSMLGKNHQNRLIKVVTGTTTVEYIYDALSRRVAKTVGSTRTYYVYNGWNCISEYTGAVHTFGTAPALTPTYNHTWGLDLSGSLQGAGGVGGLLMSSKFTSATAATAYYPLYDGNGNITAYIDNACAVQASFDYDPFGNITNNNNPQNLPYAFSTKPREPETGLYYYGYRFYDPATGRWLNRDRIEEEGGLNLYGFVDNDSVVFFDIKGNRRSSRRRGGGGLFTPDLPSLPRVRPAMPTPEAPPFRRSPRTREEIERIEKQTVLELIKQRECDPYISGKRRVAHRTIISGPDDHGPWPTHNQYNSLGRPIELTVKLIASRKATIPCSVVPKAYIGGNVWHNKYAASLGLGEWEISLPPNEVTPDGHSKAGYDGQASIFSFFEAKTGYQKFPWSNGRALGDREQQFKKQQSVASYCGFAFFVAVDNKEGAVALSNAFPSMPIHHIPFAGGEFLWNEWNLVH